MYRIHVQNTISGEKYEKRSRDIDNEFDAIGYFNSLCVHFDVNPMWITNHCQLIDSGEIHAKNNTYQITINIELNENCNSFKKK